MKTEKLHDQEAKNAFYHFLHIIEKMPLGIIKLTQEQYEFAEKHLDLLQYYHPNIVYTLKPYKAYLIKGARHLKALKGEAAQVEERFIRDRRKKNRQAIVKAFDDLKRGYIEANEGLDKIKQLMK